MILCHVKRAAHILMLYCTNTLQYIVGYVTAFERKGHKSKSAGVNVEICNTKPIFNVEVLSESERLVLMLAVWGVD